MLGSPASVKPHVPSEHRARRAVIAATMQERDMANDTRDADRAWELMKKIGFAAAITGTRPAIGTNRKVAI
jgi:hypothetical protein